jgi:hypothetical protein
MNAANLAFSIFDGDVKDGDSPCTDAVYGEAVDRFNQLAAPVIYVPGDNEWTDCHEVRAGGYNNLERLAYIRQTMFSSPRTFGQRHLTLDQQAPPYVENTRWVYNKVVFAGLNMPGSNNNKVSSRAECTSSSVRTQQDCDADNEEYLERDGANVRWMRDTFRKARERGAVGVMLVIQADPSFDLAETPLVNERALPQFAGYTNFLNELITETRTFAGQVVLVHGDSHIFKIDKPLFDRGVRLVNFTRVSTFGSPDIHWIRVEVDPNSPTVFTFTPVMVPSSSP